jgi:hypothetical protein
MYNILSYGIKFCFLLITSIFYLFIGCEYHHKFTSKVCSEKVYTEVFTINVAGVDECFLTDSINFRIRIGTFDEEHESYVYECKGDSIFILKKQTGKNNCRWIIINGKKTVRCDVDTVGMQIYSLSELRQRKIFD